MTRIRHWVLISSAWMACTMAGAADLALYQGAVDPLWYDATQLAEDIGKIKAGVKGLGEVVIFKVEQSADFESWVRKNLDDGEVDIIWVQGTLPALLYGQDGRVDASLAEAWLDKANMFINVGDWFAYRSDDWNSCGAGAAEDILDCEDIIKFRPNTPMTVTEAGRTYIPSLGRDVVSDRPVTGWRIREPWEVLEVFAVHSSGDKDPVVLRNRATGGYLAVLNQATAGHAVDRAQATIEFVNNWVAEKVLASAK